MVHHKALRRAAAVLPALLGLATLGACGIAPASGPAVVTERWTDTRPAPRGDAALRNAMLSAHSDARRTVGLSPLVWDAGLVADAARYAAEMARTRRFAHAPHDPAKLEGENLWMGTRGAYAYGDMIAPWVAERRYYRAGRIPDTSSTGKFGDVAHYTQIIWRNSTHVGCALASNASDDYLVCRYTPAGNIVGQSPL